MRKMLVSVARVLTFSLVVLGGFFVPTSSAHAVTGLTDCRFGIDQVFDVQWNISGPNLNISNVTRPYYSEPLAGFSSAGQYPDNYLQSGDFFQFTEAGGVVGLSLFDSEGNLRHVTHASGKFQALGDGFVFFLGDGFYGTVITTTLALNYGESESLPVSNESPTIEEGLAFTSCSGSPLSYSLPFLSSSSNTSEDGSPGPESSGERVNETPAIGMELSRGEGQRAAGALVSFSGLNLAPGSEFVLTLAPYGEIFRGVVSDRGRFAGMANLPSDLPSGAFDLVLTAQGPNGEVLRLSNSLVVSDDGLLATVSGNTGSVTSGLGSRDLSKTTADSRLAYTGTTSPDSLAHAALVLFFAGILLLSYAIRARNMFDEAERIRLATLSPWEILRRPIHVPGFDAPGAVSTGETRSLVAELKEIDILFSKILASRIHSLETRWVSAS